MADDDVTHCMDEIQQEISVYWTFVYISLALTVDNVIVLNVMRRTNNPEDKYGKVAKLFIVSGILKCLFGILLISVLLPKCPSDCTCSHITMGHFIYGYIALGLGVLWLYYGYDFQKKAQAAVEYTVNEPEVAMTEKSGASIV